MTVRGESHALFPCSRRGADRLKSPMHPTPGDVFVIEPPGGGGYGGDWSLPPGSMVRFNTEVAEFSEDAEVAYKRAMRAVAILRALGGLRDLRVKADLTACTIPRPDP